MDLGRAQRRRLPSARAPPLTPEQHAVITEDTLRALLLEKQYEGPRPGSAPPDGATPQRLPRGSTPTPRACPTRVITGGVGVIPGATMAEKASVTSWSTWTISVLC